MCGAEEAACAVFSESLWEPLGQGEFFYWIFFGGVLIPVLSYRESSHFLGHASAQLSCQHCGPIPGGVATGGAGRPAHHLPHQSPRKLGSRWENRPQSSTPRPLGQGQSTEPTGEERPALGYKPRPSRLAQED